MDDPIPLSGLQHAVYGLRQAALILVERLWEENRSTAEGRVLHARVDQKSKRYARLPITHKPLTLRDYPGSQKV